MKSPPSGCTNSLPIEARRQKLRERILPLRAEKERIDDQIYVMEQEAIA